MFHLQILVIQSRSLNVQLQKSGFFLHKNVYGGDFYFIQYIGKIKHELIYNYFKRSLWANG